MLLPARQCANEANGSVQRREAFAFIKGAKDGQPHRRIEGRKRQAAMDDAARIKEAIISSDTKDNFASLMMVHLKRYALSDWRLWQFAILHGGQEFHSRHTGSYLRIGYAILDRHHGSPNGLITLSKDHADFG